MLYCNLIALRSTFLPLLEGGVSLPLGVSKDDVLEVHCWPSFWEMLQAESRDYLNYLQQDAQEEEEED